MLPTVVRALVRHRRPLLPVVVALLSLLALALLADAHRQFDLRVYSGADRAWLHGKALYDYLEPGSPYGFTYPPFAALVLLPLAVLPFWTAYAVTVVVDAAVVTATAWWLAARIAPRYGWSTWYVVSLAVPVCALLEPVRDTIGFGQVNLMLVALVVLDLDAARRGRRWAGVLIGIAAAVKLTPALFIILLLVVSRRAALQAVAAGALATTAAFVVAPATSWQFWTSTLYDTSRVGKTDIAANQALSGVLARLVDAAHQPFLPWLLLVVAVAGVGLRRAVVAMRAGDDVAAMALTGLTGALCSPLTWIHHLWWVVPAIAVLIDEAAARRSRVRWLFVVATVGLFVSSWPDHVRQRLGHHLDHGFMVALGESSYALGCLVLVLALPIGRAAVRRIPPPPGQQRAGEAPPVTERAVSAG